MGVTEIQPFAKVPAENDKKRVRRVFDTDLVRRSLEAALAHDSYPPIYPTHIAERLGYNRTRVRDRFPDLWTALSQKCRAAERAEVQRRQALCNTASVRQQLEAIVASDEEPPPIMEEVAAHLGFSQKMLDRFFPDLCNAIVAKRRHPFNRTLVQQQLEAILASDEAPPPSMYEVARRLGYDDSSNLYYHFSELCRAIAGRFEQRTNLDGIRAQLEAVLASAEDPAPNMTEVARRLGYDPTWLHKRFPPLCRAIAAAARRRTPIDPIAVQQVLEAALANDARPAPTVSALARQLGHDSSHLRERFPDLCQRISARNQHDLELLEQELAQILANSDEPPQCLTAIARQLQSNPISLRKYFLELCRMIIERHQAYRSAKRIQRRQQLCAAVRQATLDLYAQKVYPSSYKVAALVDEPWCFILPEVNKTWRDTLTELGYR